MINLNRLFAAASGALLVNAVAVSNGFDYDEVFDDIGNEIKTLSASTDLSVEGFLDKPFKLDSLDSKTAKTFSISKPEI